MSMTPSEFAHLTMQTACSRKRLLCVALVARLLFMPQFGDANAGGVYDGEWNGSATATSGRCKPASVALTVVGQVVIGQAKFDLEDLNIRGTVSENGAFGATIGFNHLMGKFTQDMFEGYFDGFNCAWKIVLKRTK